MMTDQNISARTLYMELGGIQWLKREVSEVWNLGEKLGTFTLTITAMSPEESNPRPQFDTIGGEKDESTQSTLYGVELSPDKPKDQLPPTPEAPRKRARHTSAGGNHLSLAF